METIILNMKAIILARVSTEEQKEAGNSLPAQVARLEKYCRNKKIEILKVCSFDESAYKNQRDEFDSIIAGAMWQLTPTATFFYGAVMSAIAAGAFFMTRKRYG